MPDGRASARAAGRVVAVAEQYWIETLGCPKNHVDSEKLIGTLAADGLGPAPSPEQADLVVDSLADLNDDQLVALLNRRAPPHGDD